MDYFKEGVDRILKNWTALQLAVTQSAAGPQSRNVGDWMTEAVVGWCRENNDVDSEEIAELLETLMNQEFNVVIEDGSTDDVGRLIFDMGRIVSSGNQEEILNKLNSFPNCQLSKCKVEEYSSEILSMDTDPPPPPSTKNQPDEDGWITVTKKYHK